MIDKKTNEIVERFIAGGKTKEAIDALKQQLSSSQRITLINIEADYNRLVQEQLDGTISSDKENLRINNINKRLTVFLHNKPSDNKKNRYFFIIYAN